MSSHLTRKSFAHQPLSLKASGLGWALGASRLPPAPLCPSPAMAPKQTGGKSAARLQIEQKMRDLCEERRFPSKPEKHISAARRVSWCPNDVPRRAVNFGTRRCPSFLAWQHLHRQGTRSSSVRRRSASGTTSVRTTFFLTASSYISLQRRLLHAIPIIHHMVCVFAIRKPFTYVM